MYTGLVPYWIQISAWYGGLCNNVTQLTHALHAAVETQSILLMPPKDAPCSRDAGAKTRSRMLKLQASDFSNGAECHGDISGVFFFTHDVPIFSEIRELNWETRRQVMRRHLRPFLSASLFDVVPSHELVIHVRSGDIFTTPHPFFVQPPFSFYRKVIESRDWRAVRVVAEDTMNPTIGRILETYPTALFEPGTLEQDIRRLLAAEALVIGYGTFGPIWALLSENVRSLYAPVVPARVFGELLPGDLVDIDVHTFEFRNYIGPTDWKATPEQLRMMVEHQGPAPSSPLGDTARPRPHATPRRATPRAAVAARRPASGPRSTAAPGSHLGRGVGTDSSRPPGSLRPRRPRSLHAPRVNHSLNLLGHQILP